MAPGAEVEEVKVAYNGHDGKDQEADEEERTRDLLTKCLSFLRPFVLKLYFHTNTGNTTRITNLECHSCKERNSERCQRNGNLGIRDGDVLAN